MNLKEEMSKESFGYSSPNDIGIKDYVPLDKAISVSESYAKEKVLEYAIYVAETINDCTLTPNENKNVENDVNEWWEETK